MALFTYEAMNKNGEIISGKVSAADDAAAISSILSNGLTVLALTKEKEAKKSTSFFKKKVKVADLSLFSRQLAVMLSAGIPITQSISTMARQTENPTLAAALEDIAEDIKGGSNLVNAFSRHPDIFPPIYISMLSAGEVGGILETSLNRLAIQLQKEKQINDNIKSATSYPKMVGGFAVIMFIGMLWIIVPVFEGFIPATSDIPAITKFTFALSHSLKKFWFIWLAAFGAIVYGIYRLIISPIGKEFWEKHKMTVPLFGPIIQKSVLARFCRTLATLLQGGIPVVQALESAGPTSGSALIARAVETAIEKIKSGKNVSQPLAESGLFPPMVINMIAIGEEAGTLTELLDKVAEFYEDDVATATKSLSSIIEPIMLIGIGVIVGGMLVSLYMPIFTSVTG